MPKKAKAEAGLPGCYRSLSDLLSAIGVYLTFNLKSDCSLASLCLMLLKSAVLSGHSGSPIGHLGPSIFYLLSATGNGNATELSFGFRAAYRPIAYRHRAFYLAVPISDHTSPTRAS